MTAPAMSMFPPETRRQRYELLRGQLDQDWQSFAGHLRELGEYILPRRARFQVTDVNRGDRRSKSIVDSTATYSARTLSSGMMSGITSPARPWFRLTTPDPALAESGAVKEWLHTVTQRMSTVFLRSNLYNALPLLYLEMGVFATAAMMVMEDDEDIIRCFPLPVGSYRIATNSRLQVRIFVRAFRMTVRQLIEQFGHANAKGEPDWTRFSDNVKTLWERRQLEQWIDVVHVLTPNERYRDGSLESSRKRYASCYYEMSASNEDKFLEESGFDEFPVLCARWEVTGEDSYGTNCPGMVALGDIKQLQLGEKRGMQAIEKMVNPPMTAPSALRTASPSILPGNITYLDVREGQQGFRPVHEVNPRIQELEGKQEQIRYRIRRAFYEDLFLMLATAPSLNDSARNITAREIDERHEEKLIALGPVLEQLNQDVLDPVIDRTFAIMVRKGMIPEPPPELEGMPLRVEYISIMAQAQKMVGLAGLERFGMFVGRIAESDPSVLDKVDRDQLVDEYGEMTGVPPRVIVPDDMVASIRQARAEAAKAAQQTQLLNEAASGVKQLSETDTQGKNALTDLLAGAGANAGALPS